MHANVERSTLLLLVSRSIELNWGKEYKFTQVRWTFQLFTLLFVLRSIDFCSFSWPIILTAKSSVWADTLCARQILVDALLRVSVFLSSWALSSSYVWNTLSGEENTLITWPHNRHLVLIQFVVVISRTSVQNYNWVLSMNRDVDTSKEPFWFHLEDLSTDYTTPNLSLWPQHNKLWLPVFLHERVSSPILCSSHLNDNTISAQLNITIILHHPLPFSVQASVYLSTL